MSESKKLSTEEKLEEARKKYRKKFAYETPQGRLTEESHLLQELNKKTEKEAREAEKEHKVLKIGEKNALRDKT